ncbi:hypothetical protein GQ457_10G017890 [Hibiscus cannabinus]
MVNLLAVIHDLPHRCWASIISALGWFGFASAGTWDNITSDQRGLVQVLPSLPKAGLPPLSQPTIPTLAKSGSPPPLPSIPNLPSAPKNETPWLCDKKNGGIRGRDHRSEE